MTRVVAKDSARYADIKRRAAERSRANSAAGREIGAIPAVADSAERRKCDQSFRYFCEYALGERFSLEWSPDHLRIIAILESVGTSGGLSAIALPRGSGKTALCEALVLWVMLTARHPFVVLVGATADKAIESVKRLKLELLTNDRLLELYPGVCYPIRCLEGEAKRAGGQLHHGKRTFIEWGKKRIGFAHIVGERASGALVLADGITGSIRGAQHGLPDGRVVRPTLAIVDDPQTDESAESHTQTESRLRTVRQAIKGLAGPGMPMGVVVPCTVIREGDLADQLLDRQRNPEWRGILTKLVNTWPTRADLWDRYARIREDSLRAHGDIRDATAFYREHRGEMDAGAEVPWQARVDKGHISALQTAYELYLSDPLGFPAEYQNTPVRAGQGDAVSLSASEIAARVNGVERHKVPEGLTTLTAFIDVQKNALWYGVTAWGEDASAGVIDYGAWPEQTRSYFTLRDITRTLGRAYPGGGMEASIALGLEDLVARLAGREYRSETGETLRVSRILVDAGWGESTGTVFRVCKESPSAAILLPSFGVGITASMAPMNLWPIRAGDKVGHNWRIARGARRSIRSVRYDANAWKSCVAQRLITPASGSAAMRLYGADPMAHRMIADHCVAEIATRTSGKGRELDEWRLRPGGPDNHLWDCLVGCAVGASIAGVVFPGQEEAATRKNKRGRLKLSELQKGRRR